MPDHGYARTRGVKWDKNEDEFLMWCPGCAGKGSVKTFWPLSKEFWIVEAGLTICRACRSEQKRRDETRRRATKRDEIIAKNKAYYHDNKELLRWKDNQRKARRKSTAATLKDTGATA